MHEISDLSDYPAIRKLASALYKLDSSQHGAAIMIGAGFSRSAARHVSGEKMMPLWNDFSKKLAAELNPNDSDISFLDPLRVAEEYRAYFGQAAFNDRIRSDIDDNAWRVSPKACSKGSATDEHQTKRVIYGWTQATADSSQADQRDLAAMPDQLSRAHPRGLAG